MSNVSELLKSKKVQPSSLRFGFLGLGIMASGIVKNLINFEHRVNLWCETPSKVSTFFVLFFFSIDDQSMKINLWLIIFMISNAFAPIGNYDNNTEVMILRRIVKLGCLCCALHDQPQRTAKPFVEKSVANDKIFYIE